MKEKKFSHLNENGEIKMVSVTDKDPTKRVARATGRIYVSKEVIRRIKENRIEKGNVLTTAKVAGIMGAKKTDMLIPLCHTLGVDFIDLGFEINPEYIDVFSYVEATHKTGVEMESLVAVTNALLTIYDMCKAIDKSMEVSDIKLIEKRGGKTIFYRNKILSLNISKKRGIPKTPVDEVEVIKDCGIKSDAHCKESSKRQVSLLSTISIQKIKDKGLDVNYGAFAENITVRDIPLYEIPVGTKIRFENGVIMEVTQIGKECHDRCKIYEITGDCVMPREGIFTKVLKGGRIRVGEEIIVEF